MDFHDDLMGCFMDFNGCLMDLNDDLMGCLMDLN